MSWEQKAACRQSPDPDAFFEMEEAEEAGRPADQTRIEAALSICRGCPVRAPCLEYGIATLSLGIWGGTLADQRPAPTG